VEPKIRKKHPLKPAIFRFQGRSRLSMLVPAESYSAVQQCLIVMISSKSLSLCNLSHARLAGSSRNREFRLGYPNLTRSYGRLLEPIGGRNLLLKSTFNAENFIHRLSFVYIVISAQLVYSWNVCGSLKLRNNSLKPPPMFGVQGRLRSSMLVPPESSSAVL